MSIQGDSKFIMLTAIQACRILKIGNPSLADCAKRVREYTDKHPERLISLAQVFELAPMAGQPEEGTYREGFTAGFDVGFNEGRTSLQDYDAIYSAGRQTGYELGGLDIIRQVREFAEGLGPS